MSYFSEVERKGKNGQKTSNNKVVAKILSVNRVFRSSQSITSSRRSSLSSSKVSTYESSSQSEAEENEDIAFLQQCSISQATSEGEYVVSEDDADEDQITKRDSEEETEVDIQKNKFKRNDSKFEKTLKTKNDILESL